MGESRIITPVVENSLDPVWNHQEELIGFDPEDDVEVTVWDDDPGNMKPEDGDFLGKTILTAEAFYPKGMPATDIPLGESGNAVTSIRIQIIVQGREEDPPNINDAFRAHEVQEEEDPDVALEREMEAKRRKEGQKGKEKEGG